MTNLQYIIYRIKLPISAISYRLSDMLFNWRLQRAIKKYGGGQNIPSDVVGKIMDLGPNAWKDIEITMAFTTLLTAYGLDANRSRGFEIFRLANQGKLLKKSQVETWLALFNADNIRQAVLNHYVVNGEITPAKTIWRLGSEDKLLNWIGGHTNELTPMEYTNEPF